MATNARTELTDTVGGKGIFPPFQSETYVSQLLWLALAFVALYLLMSRLALPRLGAVIEARRARIEGDLSEAQRLRSESEAVITAYEKSLADARSRAQTIANTTRDRLMSESEQSRKALEAKLNADLGEAEAQIARTKTAAMAHVREVAVDSASAIVERLIGTTPLPSTVATAVDHVLKR